MFFSWTGTKDRLEIARVGQNVKSGGRGVARPFFSHPFCLSRLRTGSALIFVVSKVSGFLLAVLLHFIFAVVVVKPALLIHSNFIREGKVQDEQSSSELSIS